VDDGCKAQEKIQGRWPREGIIRSHDDQIFQELRNTEEEIYPSQTRGMTSGVLGIMTRIHIFQGHVKCKVSNAWKPNACIY
jgi:hypothetical protein